MAQYQVNSKNFCHRDFDGYVAAFLPHLTYYEFKMVDHRTRTTHAEKNQGEIFKVRDQGREDRRLPASSHLPRV
jgi:hypothetical protein